jgi:hypothetical protein
MISGSTYVLIGIKNRWIHIFLSSAYLTSFSITVLIVYVMSPPISSAIQGAYFVAAFMTGVLFGAGSLMFPDITEGLGCLLGGVCLSMWFLVLRPGGSLTGTVSKIVFVLVFGIAVWSLSFIRRTRPYALIGAASFSGATAVVLGIDCFSRAGLKEFWLYIWALNDNVFPLNTETYPITRSMQVEIAAIVLLTIVGVISQLKLWKVLKDRREKKEAEQSELERRKSAMEEAMGRSLEARTDREKAQWESIYGPQWDNIYSDHVRGSRSTIIGSGTDFVDDNRKSWISAGEVPAGSARPTAAELNRLSLPRADHNSTSRSKRQSAITVQPIPEDNETQAGASASTTDVQSRGSADGGPGHQSTSPQYSTHTAPSLPLLPFITPNSASTDASSAKPSLTEKTRQDPNPQLLERRKSGSSILKRLSGQDETAPPMTSSEEALIVPEAHRSRASSIAATLNDELGELDLQSVYSETEPVSDGYHKGLVSGTTSSNRLSYLGNQPPSPAALSVEFDPEELARPVKASSDNSLKPTIGSSILAPSRSNAGRTNDFNASKSTTVTSEDVKGRVPSRADLSSADSLTEGAVVQIPSQLSNVVMTYRTNEWAKHISIAEVPIDDQINAVLGDTLVESPVQLVEAPAPVRVEELGQTGINAETATNTPASHKSTEILIGSNKRHSTVRYPPESHAAPARMTLGNRKDAPSLQRSLSDQSLAATPQIIIRPPTAANSQHASRPPWLSWTGSTAQENQPLPTAIDENGEAQFPSSSPSLSPPPTSPTHSASVPLAAQPKKAPGSPNLLRSASYQGLPIGTLSNQIYQQAIASTSDTRLSSSHDTRQPPRRASTFVPGKRDSMLADWQGSLKRENSMTAIPKVALNQRRAEMMLERRQSEQSKQRQEVSHQYREKVVEQAMRTTDMQALHREAMKKMQAKANKHV